MPPSVEGSLLDSAIKHQIDLSRYSNGVVRRIIAALNKVDVLLYAELTDALERLNPASFTVQRLESLLASVKELNTEAYAAVGRELTTEMRDFVKYEASFQAQALTAALPVQVHVASISAEVAYTAALARPFSITKDGAVSMSQYLAGLTEQRAAMVRNTVNMGYLQGETTAKIVQRIKGTRAAQYADGLLEKPRQDIETMVRTAVNHMANVTQQNMLKANADIVSQWRFLATLDGRTSITCASLSGKLFDIGKGPVPPRHPNCRSFALPVVKSFKELGIDLPEIVMEGKTRSSMGGQIDADTTFTGWLRSKPAGIQDEILGATRGKLFRANEIDVDKFTNNKGIVYSLDDLRKRDAALFKKAGI